MSTRLQQGGNISLTKEGLHNAVIACGWDVNKNKGGKNFDLDLTAAALDSSDKVPELSDLTDPGYQEWFIHANHRRDSAKTILFMGDNRTGAGRGDDELIKVDLDKVPAHIERIVFAVVIWRAEERGQVFGAVENAFIRVYDEKTKREIARYDLTAEFSEETLVMFGELYRRGGEWKFRAVGQGYDAATYRHDFGIQRAFETEYARPGYH